MLQNFLPRKLASQLLVLLVLALLVAFAISTAITINAQTLNDRTVRDRFAAERVYELTKTVEALARDSRQQFTKSARTKTTYVKVETTPAVLFTADNERSRNLATEIMAAINRENVRASVLSRNNFSVVGDPRESGRNREVIAVSVPLEANEWLNFNSREPLSWYTNEEEQFRLFLFGISMICVTGVAWFFVRKLTQPVEAIAAAAHKAANGDRSARIPEEGPAEFREAAKAFNSMQTQIELFETERNRTIAAVGHDLRTPITSLRVRAEMIKQQDLREPMINTLEQVSVMADGLISYARHRKEEEYVEKLDLHALVRNFANENNIPFHSRVYPKVTAGPVSLTRAIRNLTDNANRYAKLVSISLDSIDGNAIICICDEGPGISQELLDTIRAPFVRGENSRNIDTGGYGLGLTISHEIIRSHGGELILENHDNTGLCAKLVLPLSQ